MPLVTSAEIELTEPAARAARYERAFHAIAACTLLEPESGDYVQSVCEDVLAGEEAECWKCGTVVHEGPCVGEVEER